MEHKQKVVVVALLFGLLMVGFAVAQTSWSVGDHALVNWTGDGFWYPATIVAEEGRELFVVYDDGDREWVGADRIRQEDLGVGERVSVNWMGGGVYYDGVISQRIGNAIVVQYDDGDVEATTISVVRVR